MNPMSVNNGVARSPGLSGVFLGGGVEGEDLTAELFELFLDFRDGWKGAVFVPKAKPPSVNQDAPAQDWTDCGLGLSQGHKVSGLIPWARSLSNNA